MKQKIIITAILISLSLTLVSCTKNDASYSTSEEAISATLGAGIGAIAEQTEHMKDIEQ